jgi:glycosyltransferase involved in cell wall biosynthesis
MDTPLVCVCICTLHRPALLERLLERLDGQQTAGRLRLSIVVVDNDRGASAREVALAFASRSRWPLRYVVEPRRNIALARNAALRVATGDFIAFIDDDEFPRSDWLLHMLGACEHFAASGVLGPVRPHFDATPPSWVVKGGFCERPEHASGRVMRWDECRTGNVLFRRSILDGVEPAFREEFGTGGEDKDFFMRMTERRHVFRWCNEGIAYETVPPARWTRSYMLKRALLRGRNILKHPGQRLRLIASSIVALPVYTVMLPFTLVFGQHVFMKYCIRFCDHTGRLLALVGLNPIKAR